MVPIPTATRMLSPRRRAPPKGYTTHTCACGDSYVDTYVDALGHAWDNGKVTKEPTETETGVKTFTCTRCNETKTEVIPVARVDVTEMFSDLHGKTGLPDAHLRLRRSYVVLRSDAKVTEAPSSPARAAMRQHRRRRTFGLPRHPVLRDAQAHGQHRRR